MSEIERPTRVQFDKFEQIAYNLGYRDGEADYNSDLIDNGITLLSFVDSDLDSAYKIGLEDGKKYGKTRSKVS